MKVILKCTAAVAVVLVGSLAMGTAGHACPAGYKKVGNSCITRAYNPKLKIKANLCPPPAVWFNGQCVAKLAR